LNQVLACPACGHAASERLDTVDVCAQHERYAKGDAAARERLDAAWEAHGPVGPSAQSHSYAVRRCASCTLEFADPMFAPSSDWYANLYSTLDLYPSERWEYRVVCESLKPSSVVLDFGCGSGHFLDLAIQRAQRVVGIDFSSNCVDAATAKGHEALLGEAGQAWPGRPGEAHHITAFHVLEHLPQPGEVFQQADRLGTADVQLWLAIPSNQRASRRYGEFDELDAPPHHLTRWTPDALERLGQRHGWSLQGMAFEPLPLSVQVWEAGRRARAVQKLANVPAPLGPLARRLGAAAVWLSGRHAMTAASGFSMLARFTRANQNRS
jgi:SAM-dependent methyltransferase